MTIAPRAAADRVCRAAVGGVTFCRGPRLAARAGRERASMTRVVSRLRSLVLPAALGASTACGTPGGSGPADAAPDRAHMVETDAACTGAGGRCAAGGEC